MENKLHNLMYGDEYGLRIDATEYRKMTTATNLAKKVAPPETPAERRVRWKNMTPSQIIRATPTADLKKFAKRGAPMAIAELQRRTQTAQAVQMPRPDPEIDIGV